MTYNVTATGYGDTVKFYVDAEDAYKEARREAEAIFHLRSNNLLYPHPDPNVHVEVEPDIRNGQFKTKRRLNNVKR